MCDDTHCTCISEYLCFIDSPLSLDCSFTEFIRSEYDGPIGSRHTSGPASKGGASQYKYDDYG